MSALPAGALGRTCPLSPACDQRETCMAKCIDEASCEAITATDEGEAAALVACYAQCNAGTVDGGNPDAAHSDQGALDGPLVGEGPVPDQSVAPDQTVPADQTVSADTLALPDLFVSSFSVAVSGTSAFHSVTVCNSGGSTSSPIEIGLFYHSTAAPSCGASYSAHTTLNGLDGGSCAGVKISRINVPPGSYKAWIFVDSSCSITELSESNNVKSYSYTMAAPQPDLAISSFSATANNSRVNYEVAYCNNGDAFSSTVKLGLYYDPTGTPGCSTPHDDYQDISGMGAGQCSVAYFTRPSTPPGSYTSWVRLDSACALTEASESNNSASKSVTVSGSACNSIQTYDFEGGLMQGVTQSSSDGSISKVDPVVETHVQGRGC